MVDTDNELKPLSFRLVLSDYLETVDPARYNAQDVPIIEPLNYFITSGDAVKKSEQLLKDYNKLHKALGERKGVTRYRAAIAAVIKKCQKLVDKLVEVRGDAIFLECEWGTDRTLICIPKNPRKK